MDDLPELPFEKVLSYLNLEDRLKSRAVSRRWYHKINSFKVERLCYSERPVGFIYGKSRLVSDAFAHNFISSPRFASFFNTFVQTILSNLKHLRLCDLRLDAEDSAAFVPALQSFAQLEQLDIIRFSYHPSCVLGEEFKLNLPMLNSIHLEEVCGIEKLTLDAPRLQKVKVFDCSNLRLDLVHAESVEWLMADKWAVITVKNLKNLKYLCATRYFPGTDSTCLSSLEQLREFHLRDYVNGDELFDEKRRHGRADLKIYLWGLLLNGPDDPTIDCFNIILDDEAFGCFAENPSRLADEIPFCKSLCYPTIEHVPAKLAIDVLRRFTRLNEISVHKPVQDIERFLNFLKNLNNIVCLSFWSDLPQEQPQELFDRLPEHCAVQKLTVVNEHLDFRFLFRMKHLIGLSIGCAIDVESIRKVCEELPFLSRFGFRGSACINRRIRIQIEHPKQFKVSLALLSWTDVPDLNAVIQLITDFSSRKWLRRVLDDPLKQLPVQPFDFM